MYMYSVLHCIQGLERFSQTVVAERLVPANVLTVILKPEQLPMLLP